MLIRSLPSLTSLVVNVYGRKSHHTLTSFQLCTQANYSIAISESHDDQTLPYSHDFLLKRDEEVRWQFNTFLSGASSYKKVPKKHNIGTSKLLEEVKRWFQWNSSIMEIEYRIWTGYPYRFAFDRLELDEGPDDYDSDDRYF
jgi:hypothetical protein